MEKFFDRNAMLQTSIFELRNIARELGVYSPTIYKKEDLIEKMFKIINGEELPHVPKSKQGRPPKSNSLNNRLIDIILPNTFSEDKNFSFDDNSGILSLGEHTIAFLEANKSTLKDAQKIEGYLDISKEGYGFLRCKYNFYTLSKCIYVSEKQIKTHKLKTGDFIKANVRLLSDDKPGILLNVISINDEDINKFSRNNFDELELSFPTIALEFDKTKVPVLAKNTNLLLGTRNLILIGKSKRHELMKNLAVLNTIKNTKVIYGSIESLPEKTLFLNNFECESFYTTLEQPAIQHINLIEFLINRAKRIAEQGNNVVLFIDSLDKVIKNQNIASGNNLLDVSSLSLGKKLFACARCFKKGSLTVIAFCDYKTGNDFDQTIADEFENYSDNVISFL